MAEQPALFTNLPPEYASKHATGKDFNSNTEDNEIWLSPRFIAKALGHFDLDPCACDAPRPWPTADHHFTKAECDGLAQKWFGRVWMNPPYGDETFKWMSKLADHGSGVALIFSRTETKGFHRQIWERAHSIFFFEGRLTFYTDEGIPAEAGANAPSCLVSYSEYDTQSIKTSGLNGKLVLI